MSRRLVVTIVAISVLGSCSAPSVTPRQSESPSPPAAASPTSLPAAASPTSLPAAASPSESPTGQYSGPPNPLDLQPTLDESKSASAVIGSEGGSVSAIGSDGATYTLEVPPKALPLPTTITMTPLSDLHGLPMDPAPEHLLGVELAPGGLRMAFPARLTMVPKAALPKAGVATGDYLGDGQDAGLAIAAVTDTGISVEVPHFSGFWTVWPIKMDDWRAFEIYRQAGLERDFENDVAMFLGLGRQGEMLGIAGAAISGLCFAKSRRITIGKCSNRASHSHRSVAPRPSLRWPRSLATEGCSSCWGLAWMSRRPRRPERYTRSSSARSPRSSLASSGAGVSRRSTSVVPLWASSPASRCSS